MLYFLYFIHVLISLFLILVVLLQQGSGADLSVFGGGATQAAFGSRGAATLLHKLTVGGFIAFILTTIGIGFLESTSGRGSVMSETAEEAPAEAVPPPAGDGVSDSFDEPAPGESGAPDADAMPGDAGEEPPAGDGASDGDGPGAEGQQPGG